MEKQKLEKLQGQDFVSALWAFLYVIIINIFIMPINLWIRSVKNLSVAAKEGFMNASEKTEFPVLLWVKVIFEAVIFFFWPFILIWGLYHFFSGFRYMDLSFSFFFIAAILPLFFSYIYPIFISIIKELFNLALVQVMKLEKIEENTKK